MSNLASRVAEARRRIADRISSANYVTYELLLIADEHLQQWDGMFAQCALPAFDPAMRLIATVELKRTLTHLARVGLAEEATDG